MPQHPSRETRRPTYQSWDQFTEYRNLDMAREIADFVSDGKPIWRFPYFRQVLILWRVFLVSLFLTGSKSRAQGESRFRGIFSDYLVMNLFVLIMTTVEYTVKGILGLLVSALMLPSTLWNWNTKRTPSSLEKEAASLLHSYHDDIRKHPWFHCDFQKKIADLKHASDKLGKKRSFYDFFTYHFVLRDFQFRKLLAPAVSSGFVEPNPSIRGTNINYATSADGTRLLKLPVYDGLTDWVYAAYCKKTFSDPENHYDKPTPLTSVWGQASLMCRVQLSPEQEKALRAILPKNCIADAYGNGCDPTRTMILDVPWDLEVTKNGQKKPALSVIMAQFYDPEKKNFHFHDPYVPPEQDVYPRLLLPGQTNNPQPKQPLLSFFCYPRASLLSAGLINSYDKIRPSMLIFRFLAHFTTMPILGALQCAATIFDAAIALVGFAISIPLLVVSAVWTGCCRLVGTSSSSLSACYQALIRTGSAFLLNGKHFLRSLWGFYDPSYLAHDLLRENHHQAIAGGGLYQTELPIFRPKTEAELQEIVANASLDDRLCAVRGGGYSQGQQFLSYDPRQVVLSLDELTLEGGNNVTYEPDTEIVTCSAGSTWSQVQDLISQHGRALPVMQASNIFSVGGSLSTNIHGWNHHMGSLCNHIARIRYVDKDGVIQTITPEDPMFKYMAGGFGRFGVIVDVSIRTIPNCTLQLKGTELPLSDYLRNFKNHIQHNPDVGLHIGRLPIHMPGKWGDDDCKLISSNWEVTDTTPVKDQTLYREKKGGSTFLRMALNLLTRLGFLKSLYWRNEVHIETKKENPNLTVNETMNFEIQPMLRNEKASKQFWLQEFFLPEDGIEAFTRELGSILSKNEVDLINASIRFVKQETQPTALPYAPEDRYALVLCFRQNMRPDAIKKTHQWVQQAIDAALARGGTFYMPYQQFATRQQYQQAYPTAAALHENYEKEIGTPKPPVFENGLGQRYIAQNDLDFIPNLDDMRGFFETVFRQYRFEDFRQVYNEELNKHHASHEDLYQAISRRMPEISGDFFTSIRRKLKALHTIQDDLCDQARKIIAADDTPLPAESGKGLELGTYGRFVTHMKKDLALSGVDVCAEPAAKPDAIQAALEHRNLSSLVTGQTAYTAADKSGAPTYNLNYNDISDIDFGKNQYKVITCFAGAHHFPDAQVDRFFKKVEEALLPGGKFLLVEHDKHLAKEADHAAHSIFNLGTGEPYALQRDEIRNFQNVSYWVDRVQDASDLEVIRRKKGTGKGAVVSYTRKGDPSHNTMIGFTKKSS